MYLELSEEIQAHLDEKVDELVADGMSREEARQVALREFGNVSVVEEKSLDVWTWSYVENLFSDVKYGLRALRHNPVFTIVVLLTISIGIAANAVVFTVVNSVLLKPLHYPRAEELVALHQVAPERKDWRILRMVFYCRRRCISPTPSTTGHFNPWGCVLPARRTLQALPCQNRSGQLA